MPHQLKRMEEKIKTLFAVTAALLLTVSTFFAALPTEGQSIAAFPHSTPEKTVENATSQLLQKAADAAMQTAQLRIKKAKTEEEKSLAEELLDYAELNAKAAAILLNTAQNGGSVDRKQTELCLSIARAVNEAATVIAEGKKSNAGELLNKIAEMTDWLPKSNEAIGELISIENGKIYAIDQNGNKRQLQRGSVVHEGETVKTEGEKSVTIILMKDGAQWDISGESEIKLSEYHSHATDSDHCDSTTKYIIKIINEHQGSIIYSEKHIEKECTYIYTGKIEIELIGTTIEYIIKNGIAYYYVKQGSIILNGKLASEGTKIYEKDILLLRYGRNFKIYKKTVGHYIIQADIIDISTK